jgi:hypothetical protein
MNEIDLKEAHGHSSNHKDELERSRSCGCFYCLSIFDIKLKENLKWVDKKGGGTLLCPFCGIDSVIGDASGLPITPDFLEQMHKRWFDERHAARELRHAAEGLSREQIYFATRCMSEWIRIRQDNGYGYPTSADVDHSSLLFRLLSGKKALDKPPPTRFSYPDYALAEGEIVGISDLCISRSFSDAEYNVIIDQSLEWKWIDEGKGILQHKTWGLFKTWIEDVKRPTALGMATMPERKLQKIQSSQQ